MLAFLGVLMLVAPFAIAIAVIRNRTQRRLLRSATVALTVDEYGVRRELADGRTEAVDWTDLREVEVYRTNEGPHGPVGGMVLLGGDDTSGCLVPIDRVGEAGLVEALSRLPGFDVRTFSEALVAPPPVEIVVWRRQG